MRVVHQRLHPSWKPAFIDDRPTFRVMEAALEARAALLPSVVNAGRGVCSPARGGEAKSSRRRPPPRPAAEGHSAPMAGRGPSRPSDQGCSPKMRPLGSAKIAHGSRLFCFGASRKILVTPIIMHHHAGGYAAGVVPFAPQARSWWLSQERP